MLTNILRRVNFDTNKCKPQKNFVWCLPKDYNLEKHPFSCKSKLIFKHHSILIILFEVFHLQNKSLPWDYQFKFVIDEISNVNDKTQVRLKSEGLPETINLPCFSRWWYPCTLLCPGSSPGFRSTTPRWSGARTGPDPWTWVLCDNGKCRMFEAIYHNSGGKKMFGIHFTFRAQNCKIFW